jgi:quercetin dioxygenase-like cupin family protein
MIVRNVKDAKEYDVKEAYGSDAEGVAIRWISDRRTGSKDYLHNFALRYFTIRSGGYLAPHKHPWEQEIVVIRGRGIVTTKEKETEVGVGDAVYFAGDELHGFKNTSGENFEFYCIIGCLGEGENCIGL